MDVNTFFLGLVCASFALFAAVLAYGQAVAGGGESKR